MTDRIVPPWDSKPPITLPGRVGRVRAFGGWTTTLPPYLRGGGGVGGPPSPTRFEGKPVSRAKAARSQPKPWVANRIADSQRLARQETCKRCKRQILCGTDDDRVAADVKVDPIPLDELHEVAAVLMGRGSYDLIRGRLYYRSIEHYHNREYPIFARHECEKAK